MAATKVVNRQLKTDLDTKVDKVLDSSLVADTEITKLAAITGTNTGDQVIPTNFDPAGTDNSDNNAVNTLYSGLVTNATHTGDVTGATALTIANDVITRTKLATALKGVVNLGNVSGVTDIDCSLGIHFNMTMTAATSLNFINYSTEGNKTITLHIDGAFTLTQPVTVFGDWSAISTTVKNQIQIYLYDVTTPQFSSGLILLE